MSINPITTSYYVDNNRAIKYINGPANNNAVKPIQQSSIKKWNYAAGLTGIGVLGACAVTYGVKRHKNKEIIELAKDLSTYLNKPVKLSSLKSIMTKKEFMSEISTLKAENYVASKENIERGIFRADIHSHTNHSDGVGTVREILDGVAEYADNLHSKTNKKFLFAITDHNGVEGVKEALSIISENPDRFKNVKFVTGSEVSFVMPCEVGSLKHYQTQNSTECAEVLAYCFNPFSKDLNKFYTNLYAKKENTLNSIAKEAEKLYPDIHLSSKEQSDMLNRRNLQCNFNSHWTMFNYVQLKHRAVELSKEQEKPADYFVHLIKDNGISNPYQFNEFLNSNQIQTKTQMINPKLDTICKQYFPKISDNKITSPTEYVFSEVIDTFSKENTVLGFAHPAFFTANINPANTEKVTMDYIRKSNGLLQLSENYHQAYGASLQWNTITQDAIDNTNTIMKRLNLIAIGGRDNHTSSFL